MLRVVSVKVRLLYSSTKQARSSLTSKERTMKRFKFIMDDGYNFDCIALDFRNACITFDYAGLDPRDILAVEER
jgi:hypothetical protein